MKWILVIDQKPPVNKDVLFLFGNGQVYIGHMFKEYTKSSKKPIYFWSVLGYSYDTIAPVKWMPLPDPQTGYDSALRAEYNRGWCDSQIIPSEEV